MKKQIRTGLSASYYTVPVTPNLVPSGSLVNPEEYMLECIDVLEALRLTYSEANTLKALWRTASKRVLEVSKEGVTDLYDREKVYFFCGSICYHSLATSGVSKFKEPSSTLVTISNPQCNAQPTYITCLVEATAALRLTEDEALILSIIWEAACARIEVGSVLYPYSVYTASARQLLSTCSASLLESIKNGD